MDRGAGFWYHCVYVRDSSGCHIHDIGLGLRSAGVWRVGYRFASLQGGHGLWRTDTHARTNAPYDAQAVGVSQTNSSTDCHSAPNTRAYHD